jgi:hypothetical protein
MWAEQEEQAAGREVQQPLDRPHAPLPTGAQGPPPSPPRQQQQQQQQEQEEEEDAQAQAAEEAQEAEEAEAEAQAEAEAACPPPAAGAAFPAAAFPGSSGGGGSESARSAAAVRPKAGGGRAQSARASGGMGAGRAGGGAASLEAAEALLGDTITVTRCGGSHSGRAASAAPVNRASRLASTCDTRACDAPNHGWEIHPSLRSIEHQSEGRRSPSPRALPSPRPAAAAAAAQARQPCAALPYQLRPVTPASGIPGGAAVGGAAKVAKASGAGGGGSARTSLPPSSGATKPKPMAPPTSLVEKMRQRQAALAALVDQRSAGAMQALTKTDRTPVPPHEAALVSAATRSMAVRRRALGSEGSSDVAPHDVLDDDGGLMDVWRAGGVDEPPPRERASNNGAHRGAAGASSSPRGAPERRVRTFVGLNFVR